MSAIWIDVDTAVEVPVNTVPLTDDSDFKTRETSVAYNAAGMDLVWNFITPDGTMTQTAVTPTTGGDYDWAHVGDGMYKIEIPASGGASINNATEGFGYFTGVATGVLPWRGPTIGFRAAGLNDKLVESAYSTTRGLAGTALPAAAADAAGGLPVSDAGGLDLDTQLAATNEVTAARMGALTDWINGGRLDLLLDAIKAVTDNLPNSGALTDLATASALATAQADLDTITGTDGVTLATAQGNYAPAKAGDEMDLVDAPNSTAVTALQNGLATSSALTTVDTVVDGIKAVTDNLPDSGALSSLATASALATVDSNVDAILVDTAEIGAAGAGLSAIPWNSSWDAEVQSEVSDALTAFSVVATTDLPTNFGDLSISATTGLVSLVADQSGVTVGTVNALGTQAKADVNAEADTALADIHLDHLLAADYDPASKPGTSTALLNELVENDGGVSRFTTNALEQAPSGGGSDPLTLASGTIGSTGNDTTHLHLTGLGYGDDELNGRLIVVYDDSAGEYHSVWITDWVNSTALATVETLPFTPEDGTDTYVVVGIKRDVNTTLIEGADATDQIRDAVVDDATRIDASALNTAAAAVGSDGGGLTEAGGTGDHLTALPWNSSWDAEVQSEATDALNAYDPPTKAELDSGLAALNDPSASAIADAVWDEAVSDHTTNGTYGKAFSGATAVYLVGMAGTINTLDALDAAQDSQHSTTQGKVDTAQADLDILTGTDGVALATSQPNYAPAKVGDQVDLVDAPNATAVTAIQSGLATSSALSTVSTNISTLLTRIPSTLFSGITSLAGWLRLALRSDAAATTDEATSLSEINANGGSGAGDYAATTDSQEAIVDTGNNDWVTGVGGSSAVMGGPNKSGGKQ